MLLNVPIQFGKINVFDKVEVQTIYQISHFLEKKIAELLPGLINGHIFRSEFKYTSINLKNTLKGMDLDYGSQYTIVTPLMTNR